MDEELEDLIDSIDSDNSDWTRRGVIKLLSFSRFFKSQVSELEVLTEKIRANISMFTLASALCSTFGSTGVLVNLINSIINMYYKSENDGITFRVGVLIIGFVFNVITTALIAFLKVKSYEEKLQSASVCANGYLKLLNDINSELYKKAKNRSSMAEMFVRLNAEYGRLHEIQVSNLDMNTRRMNIEMELLEKRLSIEQNKVVINVNDDDNDKKNVKEIPLTESNDSVN